MKIAVIGSGISGIFASYHLRKEHQITLFEKNDYLGGHTATKELDGEHQGQAIDTGFIVFNNRTYPRFQAFLADLGVPFQNTDMSYSVSNAAANLEYNGHTFSTLFAQKRNWLSPKFYRFLYDIYRFNKLAKASYAKGAIDENLSLREFLEQHKFNQFFRVNYLMSMGAAIWSSSIKDMDEFPALFFIRFFVNHGLLEITDRPQWYVIKGGSHQYVKAWRQQVQDDIEFAGGVTSVRRKGSSETSLGRGFIVSHSHGEGEFDAVVFACHSDQALKLLGDSASPREREILGDMPYQQNDVILHTDISRLPKRQAAWAAWNYMLDDSDHPQATLTYNMNILQGLDSEHTYCVSLNQTEQIDPAKIIGKYLYDHPVFNRTSFAAQQRRDEINGVDGCYFCGAYWYNGFHEDGVRSAQDIVDLITSKSNQQPRNAA
ncbi:FAD-dependent oxidoreductase [Neiella sp. HB171785]|uniref:FAD-dependent oxidoreductase n=1 Tax=Neiella litorisoli TaxID=2771431 RepID=A0A8J6QQ81_9GAMM|nr:FAD-dependent oxidoreductase [Neiella litorisoli]MBD1388519.1 FAD-dependent oxidoreductase [Neiella litorisoli]